MITEEQFRALLRVSGIARGWFKMSPSSEGLTAMAHVDEVIQILSRALTKEVLAEDTSPQSITKEQIKDLGWALSVLRGFDRLGFVGDDAGPRIASAEAGFKVLAMAGRERAAPKAYADACSDRGQQTRNEHGVGEHGRHELPKAYGGSRGGGKRENLTQVHAEPDEPAITDEEHGIVTFEDDIKGKDW